MSILFSALYCANSTSILEVRSLSISPDIANGTEGDLGPGDQMLSINYIKINL